MNTFFHLSVSFICTLLLPTFLSSSYQNFSNTILSVIFFISLAYLFYYSSKHTPPSRLRRYTSIFGFLLSVLTSFGYSLTRRGSIAYSNILYLISILFYANVFSILLCIAWTYFEKVETTMVANKTFSSNKPFLCCIHRICSHPFLLMLILQLCWLPCYLSTFPGNFVYDATPEYTQILNGFNTDFPLLHSFIITRILSITYNLTGSYNTGIAIFVIGQMILISGIFSHIIYHFNKIQINEVLLSCVLLYFSTFPVIHLLVTSTVRDVLFSSLVTYSTFLIYLMSRDRKAFFSCWVNPLFLSIVLILTLLSRNNNSSILPFLLTISINIVIWFFAGKQNLTGVTVFTVSSLGGYFLLTIILTELCHPLLPASSGGALSLLTQPITKAYFEAAENWTDEEKAEFEQYFDLEGLRYVPKDADLTKFRYIAEKSEFPAFLNLWFRIGLKNPGCYLDAIFTNTMQMWFPNCVVDGYVQAGLYGQNEKCYFYFSNHIESPGTLVSLLPHVHEFYNKIGLFISFEKIPVISMLFSIGFHFWVLLNCCFYVVYRKCYHLFFPLLILLCYTLLSAFVPLVLLRYFAALFFTFPLVILFTLQPAHC